MHETVESTAVVDGALDRVKIVIPRRPDDFHMPRRAASTSGSATPMLGMEARLHDYKRDAMLAFVRANKLNRSSPPAAARPKIGVITIGKSYLDVRQALDELGIDEVKCNDLGLRLYKIACPWPIGRRDLMEFADGLDLIIVVEEKRSLIEVQVREELYGTANQPVCIGKKDEHGNWLFPVKGALDPNDVAICIGERLLKYVTDENLRGPRVAGSRRRSASRRDRGHRGAHSLFLLGLPAQFLDRGARRACAPMPASAATTWRSGWTARRSGFTQMGGEGANWIGEAPFSKRPHVFQNLGDGTYNHSGYMAIRAAIASGVNITYKILFNDAVAMTGGQRTTATSRCRRSRAQVAAEGRQARRRRHRRAEEIFRQRRWPHGITIHHRDDLMQVQKELAEIPGVTVLIYDQTCAAEKRRRRKRGTLPRSRQARHHQRAGLRGLRRLRREVELRVGAAAGDRVRPQAHHRPVELQQGFLLREGLLPVLRHRARREAEAGKRGRRRREPPAPPRSEAAGDQRTYDIIVTGVGGTGIVTIGGILGMAAHLEGKGVGVIDMAGLAQKGGAVYSHIRIAETPEDIHAIRVAAAAPTWCSAATSWSPATRRCCGGEAGGTAMVVNTAEILPGEFTRNADFSLPTERLKRAIVGARRHASTPISSTRRGSPPRCSASRSAPTCSCSAMPISSARCRSRRRRHRAGDRAQRRGGAR